MSDTREDADLRFGDASVAGTSIRSQDFADAALMGGKKKIGRGWQSAVRHKSGAVRGSLLFRCVENPVPALRSGCVRAWCWWWCR